MNGQSLGSWRYRLGGVILLAVLVLPFVTVQGSDSWAGPVARGNALAAEHRLLSAAEQYDEAAGRPGGDAIARPLLGGALLRRGEWKEAADQLKLAEVGGSIERKTLSGLATAQRQLGDLSGSVKTLRRQLSLRPEDPEAWVDLVTGAAEAGLVPDEIRRELSGAAPPPVDGSIGQRISFLEGACLLGPDTQPGIRSLESAATGPGADTAASAVELLTASRSATGPAASLAVAGVLMSQGLIGPALSRLGGEYQGPLEARRLALTGYGQLRRGQPAEAEASLRASLQVDPGEAMARTLLASHLRAEGDPEGALAILEQSVRTKPLDSAAYLEAAYALADAGDYGSASQALGRAVAADPNDGELLLAAANFIVERQYQVSTALDLAREAARLLSRRPDALGTLAWALHLTQNSQEALPLLQEAVAGDPESALLRYRLGSVYEQLGSRNEARHQYLMVKELDGAGKVWKRAQSALAPL